MTTQEIKNLTKSQVEEQISAINTARFLMENVYGAKFETVNELQVVLNALNKRLDSIS